MPAKKNVKKKIIAITSVKKKFPVVAIGASVGGLKAASSLFKNLPANTGMAYILVQHLDKDHKSYLTSIISQITKMKVQEIENMDLMSPDNVYVIPPNKGIKVTDGHIKLVPRSKGIPVSIDILFASLAATHRENVIGVILSGNGSDGAKGLRAIKDAGGLTFVQDNTAQAGGMPTAAIEGTEVDYILPPEKIAAKLSHIGKTGVLQRTKKQSGTANENTLNTDLKSVLDILHKESGVDFSHYKMATIKRRLHHKVQQSGIGTVKEYLKRLSSKNNPPELSYKDLLVNVTSFFRDKETFRYLKSTLLPKLLKNVKPGATLRIWIPACSTGQEAYSIAILISELQENKNNKVPVQIFATDLSENAINTARVGEFSASDMQDISRQRLRFFVKTGDRYTILKKIREMCVFAPHNLLQDPPFFRIDFISCRNLLIYFDATAQKKVLSALHFGLREGGYMMLGNSETIGSSLQLFTLVNNNFKVYTRKKNAGVRLLPELNNPSPGKTAQLKKPVPVLKKNSSIDPFELDNTIDAALLSSYMPACAVINKEMEILQFRGSTSVFLSHPSGKASLNILKMIRPEFSLELRDAIHKVFKTKRTIRKSGIEIKIGSAFQLVSLEVSPLKIEWDETLLLIVFTVQEQVDKYIETSPDGKRSATKVKSLAEKDAKIKKLTRELNNIRGEMNSVIEAQENAYQELQAASEEIVSTNEEFQTLNEELETSKEEIEATNEELISTNQELQMRNDMLSESYEYSDAIISTIHEPMLVLDKNLRVKSASKSFYKKFRVTKEETEGMMLSELGNHQWDITELNNLLKDVRTKNIDFDNFEVTQTFPSIGEKIFLLNAHRIEQKNHKELLILLALDDVTERSRNYQKEKDLLNKDLRSHKENNEELERAVRKRTRQLERNNKELEIANKDLTSFTYVSSHDLQEPLRKIQNFVTVIMQEEEKNLSEAGKGYFLRMKKTAHRMQALIEDLLTYSRTKIGEHIPEQTNLKELVEEVANEFEDVLLEKKGTVNCAELGFANVIPFQFRQLFHNLISNSLKFSKLRKAIKIEIKARVITGEKTGIKNISPGTKYLNIIYTDNGIGFDPQYNERIFEVFQRLHGYEKYAGTGIGLAICKRIVENHMGYICASGKHDKGARFDIYIPSE